MDYRTYILQLGFDGIDAIKFNKLQDCAELNEKYHDTLEYYREERQSHNAKSREQETLLPARLEKAKSYNLGTLIRLELSNLSQYYIDCLEWDQAIHYAVEEEELACTAVEKLECLRRLLLGYMAKKDYIRAALVAERIESTFPIDLLDSENEDFSLFNCSQNDKHVEEVVFLMIMLAVVRGTMSTYVTRLNQERHWFTQFINPIDLAAYRFIFAIIFNQVPNDKAVFGDVLSVLKNDTVLVKYLQMDPWLSGVENIHTSLLHNLKTILQSHLLNIEKCPNEELRVELRALFQ